MYVKTGLIAAMIIHIQIVQSQNQVALGIVTSTPYQCDKEIKLKCTYTGSDAWDSSANRIWRVDGSLKMTNGIESPVIGKYKEGEINTSEKSFILIINNLEEADLKKKYSCRYNFDDLLNAVTIGGSCVNCMICSRDCMLYGMLGLFVGFFFELVVNYKCLSAKNHVMQAITVGIEGLVITLLVAGLIGYFLCPCLTSISPLFIVLGIPFGSALLLILLYQYKFEDKDGHGSCHLISLGVLTCGTWILVKKCTNGRR